MSTTEATGATEGTPGGATGGTPGGATEGPQEEGPKEEVEKLGHMVGNTLVERMVCYVEVTRGKERMRQQVPYIG